MSNERIVRAIYYGQFERIPLASADRAALLTEDGLVGRQLFVAYVESYSDQCFHFLSADRKEIEQTITTVSQRKDALGTVLSEEVLRQETRSTGTWAEPEYADAYIGIVNSAKGDALVRLFDDIYMRRSDSLAAASVNVLNVMLRTAAEARHFLVRHGCDSAQSGFYGRNLLNYVRLQNPTHQLHAFGRACRANLAAYIPSARPQSCPCVETTMRTALPSDRFWALEDQFTEERLLIAAVSKVGLSEKIAQCLR